MASTARSVIPSFIPVDTIVPPESCRTSHIPATAADLLSSREVGRDSLRI